MTGYDAPEEGDMSDRQVIYVPTKLDAEREYMGRRGQFGILEVQIRPDKRPRRELVGVYADAEEAIVAAMQRQSARDQKETAGG